MYTIQRCLNYFSFLVSNARSISVVLEHGDFITVKFSSQSVPTILFKPVAVYFDFCLRIESFFVYQINVD